MTWGYLVLGIDICSTLQQLLYSSGIACRSCRMQIHGDVGKLPARSGNIVNVWEAGLEVAHAL
jgi:hypothetical protein